MRKTQSGNNESQQLKQDGDLSLSFLPFESWRGHHMKFYNIVTLVQLLQSDPIQLDEKKKRLLQFNMHFPKQWL